MAIIQILCKLLSHFVVLLWQNCEFIRILPNDLFCKISVQKLFNAQDKIYKQAGQHCQWYFCMFEYSRSRKSYQNCKSLQPFSYIFISSFIIAISRGKLHLIQLLWKSQICSIFFKVYLSFSHWDLKTVKIWFYFYFMNILVLVTNMWGWWKEKCLSRLKPRSIWTLRLHTSFCASVERAKDFRSEPKLLLSNWLESPHVDQLEVGVLFKAVPEKSWSSTNDHTIINK